MNNPIVAAIVPCYNEEKTVGKVVSELKQKVAGIEVYVYDNNSTDQTIEVAKQAGAVVRLEEQQGKASVVRRAFADIDADVYVLIDGDDTYGVEALPGMIEALVTGPYDHITGCRQDDPQNSAYRKGHGLGNRLFASLVSGLFASRVTDLFSGYRVMSRRFVKSFPSLSDGFQIETELSVHCAELKVPQKEMPCSFKERPLGSVSKLNTVRDGIKILCYIVRLFSLEHPAMFYGILAMIAFLLGLISGVPVVVDYFQTGLVERFPSAVLASSLMVIACLCIAFGVILSGMLRCRKENSRLMYLRHAPSYFPNYVKDVH